VSKVKLFLIRNEDTGKYLVWRGQLLALGKGYHWKEGKAAAAMFSRNTADAVCRQLKKAGCYNLKKVVVRK